MVCQPPLPINWTTFDHSYRICSSSNSMEPLACFTGKRPSMFFKRILFLIGNLAKHRCLKLNPMANIYSCPFSVGIGSSFLEFFQFQGCIVLFGCENVSLRVPTVTFQQWQRLAQFQSFLIARTMDWLRAKTPRQAVVYDESNHRELREVRLWLLTVQSQCAVTGKFVVGLARHGTVLSYSPAKLGGKIVHAKSRTKNIISCIIFQIPLQAGRDWWQDKQIQAGQN